MNTYRMTIRSSVSGDTTVEFDDDDLGGVLAEIKKRLLQRSVTAVTIEKPVMVPTAVPATRAD